MFKSVCYFQIKKRELIWRMIGQAKISNFFTPSSQKRRFSASEIDRRNSKCADRDTANEESENEITTKKQKTDGASSESENQKSPKRSPASSPAVELSPEQKMRMQTNRINATMKLACAKTNGLVQGMGPTWFSALEKEFTKPYFIELSKYVEADRKKSTVYPPAEQVFSWTQNCDINKVKVVILGQDPYHGPRQAHGHCFSVQKGVPPPPSLKNIYKELENDVEDFQKPNHGYLLGWAKQGVLLLNAVLTVKARNANSHQGKGWEKFTDATVSWINKNLSGVVFMLWGSYAQKKGAYIDKKKHCVLKGVHPSPLSAHRGFFGCKHFTQANKYLQEQGKKPIHWSDLP